MLNFVSNSLKQIPDEIILLTNLTTLLISRNFLLEMPRYLENWNHPVEIDISENIFKCDCNTFWMTAWLGKSDSPVLHPEGIVCFSGQGLGKRITDLQQNDVGCNDPLIHAIIGISVTFVLLAIVIAVIYRYRGYIKIWLYTRFYFHPWNQVQENLEEKEFDAFVSHHHEDWDWVLDTLMPKLEDKC